MELENAAWDEIVDVEEVGEDECYDIHLMEGDCWGGEPNFVADGFVVHNCGMHHSYVRRKNGEEAYERHPKLAPILDTTYFVITYQEQILRILHEIGRIPKSRCEKLRKAISKKKEAEFQGAREKFVEGGQITLGWPAEKVRELWAQGETFSGYGFSLNHAVPYTYISARLLWMKAYFPLEFYAATLLCEKDQDKVKEYKADAKRHGVRVRRVDINKSQWNFEIVGDEIYMGFSNIKGVGKDVANRIVAGQPYASFEEFLAKFGTAGAALKPLIGLGLFADADRATLYEFAEHYRDTIRRRADRDKRAAKSRQGIIDELRYILPEPYKPDAEAVMDTLLPFATAKQIADFLQEEDIKYAAGMIPEPPLAGVDLDQIAKTVRRYRKNLSQLEAKRAGDAECGMAGFAPAGDIPADLKKLYASPPSKAERLYYGFEWNHPLERSPDYKGGMTLAALDEGEAASRHCEVLVVRRPQEKKSKKDTVYYNCRVEDANGRQVTVNVWAEDYDRFRPELEWWDEATGTGNMLSVELERPGGDFSTYTFRSWPRHLRRRNVMKEKWMDERLFVLKRPAE